MIKQIVYFLLLFVLYLPACKDKDTLSSEATIVRFSFLKKNNPSLSSNMGLEIADNKIKGNVPFNVSLDELVATFEYTGVDIKIEGVSQVSDVTTNNYKEKLTYTIVAADRTTATYEAEIIRFTGLPLVFITTDNGEPIDSKEEYRKGNVEIVAGSEFENLDVEMKIRGRGNSTWWIGQNAKRPYQMKLSDKAEILGMPKDKKWILLADYSDKTMLRNKTAFELGYRSKLDWTPASVHAEVIINGEYNGTYLITQKVEESKNRVNIGKDGFLMEIDQLGRLDLDDIYFETAQFLINIKEPKLEKGDAEYNYITAFMADFEVALYGDDFKDSDLGYAGFIDVDSFIDWYMINEISKNVDAKSFSSIYMHMIPGKKMKMGPIWDFDLGFGNVNYSSAEHPEGFRIKDNPWISRMFEDPSFVAKVKERFLYYRANEALMLSTIDDSSAKLNRSQYENNRVWHTLGTYIWPNPVWYGTHQEEVDRLKGWIVERMDWLDEAYKEL